MVDRCKNTRWVLSTYSWTFSGRTRDLSDGKHAATGVMKNAFDGLIRKLDTSDLKDRRMENSKTKTEKEKGLGIASGNRPWESCRTSPKLILENGNPRKKNVAVPGKSQINVKYMIMNPGSSRTPRGVTSLP